MIPIGVHDSCTLWPWASYSGLKKWNLAIVLQPNLEMVMRYVCCIPGRRTAIGPRLCQIFWVFTRFFERICVWFLRVFSNSTHRASCVRHCEVLDEHVWLCSRVGDEASSSAYRVLVAYHASKKYVLSLPLSRIWFWSNILIPKTHALRL